MTLQEKIKLLQSINASDALLAAGKQIPGIGYSFDEKRAYVRKDIRKFITETLNTEGVSVRQLAIAVGMNYSNLIQYLKGARTIPEKYLERILGLLSEH